MNLIFDIETDGLIKEATTIHALCIKDADTGKNYSCTDNSKEHLPIGEGLKMLQEADLIVGHNILCFDIPVIQKLHPDWKPKGQIRDTLTISRLIWTALKDNDYACSRKYGPNYTLPPRLFGRHSLESWGHRIGDNKGDFGKTTDWQHWSLDMQLYCMQDVEVTHKLWKLEQSKNYSERAIELEHQFQQIIYQQETNGFPFDIKAAEKLYIQLCAERETLRTHLLEIFPPIDKGDWFTPKVNNKTRGYQKGVTVWRPKITEFNPTSRDDIAERFKQKYHWQPQEYTTTGKPIIDDEILSELPYPEAKQLAKYFLLAKRIGQIGEGAQAWLKTATDHGTYHAIHGRVTTNGAVTGRCTHHDPNLAQVPAAGSLYGHECRALFTALPGYSLLGCDASGLELRCLAHYMARYDGGHYADVILHGDIHWENALALGLLPKGTKRDKDNPDHEYARNKVAKRFIYAFLYGAGALKIGTVCGLTDADRDKYAADKRRKSLIHRLQENEQPCDDETIAYTLKGTDLKNTFLRTLPALDSLIKDVQNKAKETKKLRGLDGRILHVRSQHSALNTLLQSAGAVSVKQATVNLWAHLRREDLADKVKQVAHVHDEFQCLVANGYEDRVGALAVQSFRDAGQQFNFRCPLDGEYKYGQNWADTH